VKGLWGEKLPSAILRYRGMEVWRDGNGNGGKTKTIRN